MKMNLKIRNSMDFKVSLGGFGGNKGGGSNEAKSAIGIETLAGVHVLGNTEYTDPNILIANWEQGSISSSGNFDSAKNVRTPDYISLPTGTKSVMFFGSSIVSGKTLQFDIMTYSESNALLQDLSWYGRDVIVSIASNAVKLRVVLRNSDGSALVPTDISDIRMFYFTEE